MGKENYYTATYPGSVNHSRAKKTRFNEPPLSGPLRRCTATTTARQRSRVGVISAVDRVSVQKTVCTVYYIFYSSEAGQQ